MTDETHATKGAAIIPLDRAPFTFKTLTAVSETDFVPKALRGKPNSILAAILIGRELGLGPMEALRSIDVIDGRPSPSAEWMVGRVFEAGHVIEVVEQTAEACTVRGKRMRDGEIVAQMEFTFTMDMARRVPQKVSGQWKTMADKANWKNYPEAMLYWRAVSQLIRQLFPDVVRGVKHNADELGSEAIPWQEPAYPEPAAEYLTEDGEEEDTDDETEPSEQAEAAETNDYAVVWPPEPTGEADAKAIEAVNRLVSGPDADGDDADDSKLWETLFEVLAAHNDWIGQTMPNVEHRVRFIHRALEYLEVWESENSLREHLARTKFAHISEMKRDELIQFANNVVMKATLATRKGEEDAPKE